MLALVIAPSRNWMDLEPILERYGEVLSCQSTRPLTPAWNDFESHRVGILYLPRPREYSSLAEEVAGRVTDLRTLPDAVESVVNDVLESYSLQPLLQLV